MPNYTILKAYSRMKHKLLKITAAASIIIIAGCDLMPVIASRGAEASDAALAAARWEMCQASPIGAIRRAFDTPEEVEAYRKICSEPGALVP